MKKLFLFLLFAFLFAFPLFAQTPVALSPVARQQFLSPTGVPLAGGCVFTYSAGSSTPLATYAESTGTFPNPNPVVLDAGGFASIYLINQAYKLVVYSSGGLNCASGSQQWTADNVSAYTILNQAQNLFLAPVTVDPPGSAGEIGYRSDIPCFRGFTTFWDCFTQNETVQTLANKTINADTNSIVSTSNIAGQYLRSNGTKFVSQVIQAGDVPGAYINNLTNCAPGTVLNELVLIAATNCMVSPSGPGLTSQFMGICIGNCGTSGTPIIAQLGLANCVFDASGPTPGDVVIVSVTTAGNCHDSGSMSVSSISQSIGRVWSSTASGPSVYPIIMFPPEISPPVGVVYSTPSASVSANIGNTTLITVPGTGSQSYSYRITPSYSQTVLGSSCSGNTQMYMTLTWQDPNASGTQSTTTGIAQITTDGTLGGVPLTNFPVTILFRAKGGTTIQYSVTYTVGSGCSVGPAYQIYPVLEKLT